VITENIFTAVTSQSSTKMAKPRITQTMPYDSPGTLSFLMPKILVNFQRDRPHWAPNGGGVGLDGDFRPISHYISYVRTLIGTCMFCIDWCYFP